MIDDIASVCFRNHRLLIFGLFFTFFLPGCVFTIEEDEDPVFIEITDIDSPRASVGEDITIKWTTGEPDKQEYELVEHTILGPLRRTIDIGNSERDLSFIFRAPTTVFIRAYDADDGTDDPASEVVVDILYDTSYKFAASVQVIPPELGSDELEAELGRSYPRLGINNPDLSKKLEFTNFVGIWDKDIDGEIAFFNENPIGLDPQVPFRMKSFTRIQSEEYNTKGGFGFPEICQTSDIPLNCHASPGLPPGFESLQRSNVIVFGGLLAYGGIEEEVTITKDSSEETVSIHRSPDLSGGEYIFMVLALSSGLSNTFDEDSGDLEMVDLYIGNVDQKLVLTAYSGISQLDASLGGSDSATYQDMNTDNPIVMGQTKGAHIDDVLNLVAYNSYEMTLGFTNIEWNVPFRRDDDLLGIPTASQMCELELNCVD